MNELLERKNSIGGVKVAGRGREADPKHSLNTGTRFPIFVYHL